MEASYIKQTVGPVLTEALTSFVLHYPYTTQPSSYATTIDPITYIANYLLDANKKQQELTTIKEKQSNVQNLVQDFSRKQQEYKEARERFQGDLGRTLAARLERIETAIAEAAALEAAKNPAEPVEEAEPEVNFDEDDKNDGPEEEEEEEDQ